MLFISFQNWFSFQNQCFSSSIFTPQKYAKTSTADKKIKPKIKIILIVSQSSQVADIVPSVAPNKPHRTRISFQVALLLFFNDDITCYNILTILQQIILPSLSSHNEKPSFFLRGRRGLYFYFLSINSSAVNCAQISPKQVVPQSLSSCL